MRFDLVTSTFLAIGIGSMLACGSGSSKTPPPVVTDVYAAGYEGNGSNTVATYWKNGAPVTLGAGSANSIFVSGEDVYVAGDGGNLGPVYWKNGTPVELTGGTDAYSIFVSGNDVYVAGGEFSGNVAVAAYWKNGVPVVLTDGTEAATAWSIFVSGTDVYVAGYEFKTIFVPPNTYTNNPVAKYWKNGTPVELTDGTQAATAYSIFVSGPDVYVAGFNCHAFIPGCNIATYWNNGTPTELLGTGTWADSIAASGSDVYVAAIPSNNVAEYFKNNVPVLLTAGTGQSAANQIAVSGRDVYVAGADWNAQGTFAQYWKNGTPVRLTDGAQYASAFSIAVVAH